VSPTTRSYYKGARTETGERFAWSVCPDCDGDKSRRAARCASCQHKRQRVAEPKSADRERARRYQHEYRLRGFGLTPEDYDTLNKAQGGKCYACGRLPIRQRLSVDHDHKTGLVRGLLCNVCNRTLGHIERDGAAVVRKLLAYLDAPPAVAVIGERYGATGRVGTKAYRRRARRLAT
jgi:hypothetical protein